MCNAQKNKNNITKENYYEKFIDDGRFGPFFFCKQCFSRRF